MLSVQRAADRFGEQRNRLANVLELDQVSASVYVTSLQAGSEVVHRLGIDREAFVYVLAGAAACDREDLGAGDAVRVSDQHEVTIRAWQTSELMLVDMSTRHAPG